MTSDFGAHHRLTSHHASSVEDAWVLLFLDGIVVGLTSIYWLFWGHFFDRGFYEATTGVSWANLIGFVPYLEQLTSTAVRLAGACGVMTSILVIAIAATAFRRRERWAWYAMWTLPLLATLHLGIVAGYAATTAVSISWEIAVFGLALLAIASSYRDFFPNGKTPR
jgi:hypothetical protein